MAAFCSCSMVLTARAIVERWLCSTCWMMRTASTTCGFWRSTSPGGCSRSVVAAESKASIERSSSVSVLLTSGLTSGDVRSRLKPERQCSIDSTSSPSQARRARSFGEASRPKAALAARWLCVRCSTASVWMWASAFWLSEFWISTCPPIVSRATALSAMT